MSQIRFSCQNCYQTIKASAANAGRKARCPSCKRGVTVPSETSLRPTSDEFTLAAMSLGDDINIEDFDSDATPSQGQKSNQPPKRERVHLGAHEIPAPRDTEYANTPTAGSDEERRYPSLLRTSIALRLLAGATLIVWVLLLATTLLGIEADLTGAGTTSSSSPVQPTSILSFAFAFRFLAGATAICILIAASEIIKVIIDIQENTFAGRRRR